MASKVFISWGGELSKKLAAEISNWLPRVLQFVKPYFTPDDIEKGARWESHIAEELSSSNVGIICLTKDNFERSWILFEAGALSNNLGKSNVCTILFDVDSSNMKGPLTCFQATKFEKTDFKKLIQTINNTGGESQLDTSTLNDVFEMWWPKLEKNISEILSSNNEVSVRKRSERDILEEILGLARMNAQQSPKKSTTLESSLNKLMNAYLEIERCLPRTCRHEANVSINDFDEALSRLCMELDCMVLYNRFITIRTDRYSREYINQY